MSGPLIAAAGKATRVAPMGSGGAPELEIPLFEGDIGLPIDRNE